MKSLEGFLKKSLWWKPTGNSWKVPGKKKLKKSLKEFRKNFLEKNPRRINFLSKISWKEKYHVRSRKMSSSWTNYAMKPWKSSSMNFWKNFGRTPGRIPVKASGIFSGKIFESFLKWISGRLKKNFIYWFIHLVI